MHLFTGLVNVFKEKIGTNVIKDPVNVYVCWTYILADLDLNENWPQSPPDFDILQGVVGVSSLEQLGFGATKDPIKYDFLHYEFVSLHS